MNARGQVTKETRGISSDLPGGAATAYYSYFHATGRTNTILAFDKYGSEIQDLTYTWDTVGNLLTRQEMSGTKNLSESFGYDGLNRLTTYGVPTLPQTVTYDASHLGNILTKTGVTGTYEYGDGTNAGPHAVTFFNGASLDYDRNGNLESDGIRSLAYSTFDKPVSISTSEHTTEFEYAPDRARYYRKDAGAAGTTHTYYLGSVEIVDRPDGKQERRRYVAGVAIETSVFSNGTEDSRTTRYVFHDHLGSIDAISDDQGENVVYYSFDAWGERRSGQDWTKPMPPLVLLSLTDITKRGFTGHEMMDEVGLIHMNGRIYDPFMGRFVQADPFVSDPTESQSLNRYSYILNNPLNATDPTGHFPWVQIFTVIATAFAENWIPAFVINSGRELARGVPLENLIVGTLSSAAFSGFSSGFEKLGLTGSRFLDRAVGYGLAGGITTQLMGGKFGHGFRSALTNALVAGTARSVAGRLRGGAGFVGRSVLGGSVSAANGGNFASGAMSMAFDATLANAGLSDPNRPPVVLKGNSDEMKAQFEALSVDDAELLRMWFARNETYLIFEANQIDELLLDIFYTAEIPAESVHAVWDGINHGFKGLATGVAKGY
ncbi:RHS repeat domain-containing protein, partial [Eudoraea sp.]